MHNLAPNETNATTSPSGQKPEDLYKKTTDRAVKRRLQTEVVTTYRGKVTSLVRRMIANPSHRVEGEQVGVIGLLVALEKYDREGAFPEGPQPDRGAAFWNFARPFVLDEIQKWMDHGVFWRPRRQRKAAAEVSRSFESLDVERAEIPAEAANVEELVANAEGAALVRKFIASLPADDQHLLTCEKRDRGNPNSPRVRRYLSLVERLTAFVRGNDADGRGNDVCGVRDAARVDGASEARRASR